MVEREPYQRCLELRQQVCVAFADVAIDFHAVAEQLPERGVPKCFVECAQHMPEVDHVKTTMDGPASRRTLFSTDVDAGGAVVVTDDESAGGESEDRDFESSSVLRGATKTVLGSDPPHVAANAGADAGQCTADEPSASDTNAYEAVVGIDPEGHGDFEYLKHFEAMQVKLQLLNAEATKLSQAAASKPTSDVDAAQVGSEEHVRRIALDIQDVMKRLTKKNKAVLDQVVQSHDDLQKEEPGDALAVPTNKPLSVFQAASYPACFTEFFYGDCAPFLKRRNQLSCQQVFDALPSREELEYSLPSDDPGQPYKAQSKSRFDTPEFYALFAATLRWLKTMQMTKFAFARPGFEKDVATIAAASSTDFFNAAMASPNTACSNADLLRCPSGQKVHTALRQLLLSTATVPLTDGYNMCLNHMGNAMNLQWGSLTVFRTHNYADN